MERHPLGSQAFIPLSENPYLVIVAPPGEFDVHRLRAFLAHAGQGVNYVKGVWHHPLLVLNEVADFILVERGGAGLNFEDVRLLKPVIITEESVAALL